MRPHRLASVIAVAGLLFAACGSDDDADEDTTDAAPTTGDLDGRSFVSSEVTGHELAAGSEIQLSFDADTMSASAGCNTLAGSFDVDDGDLAAGPFAMTQMACDQPLMEQDTWLSEFLASTPGVSLVGSTLTLTGDDATVVFEERQPAEIAGTTWVVTGIVEGDAVSTVPADSEATLVFADGVVEIDTGCNVGGGDAAVTETSIEFGPLAMTLRACPELGDFETSLLAVLDGEVAYEITGDTLSLRTSTDDGAEIGLDLTAS